MQDVLSTHSFTANERRRSSTPTSLTGNVAGLNLYVDPTNAGDGDGTILIVNPDAYTWYESPTYRLRAESTAAGQVTIGYYGFGAIATKVGSRRI
jgi:hypothetical protein